MFKLIFLIFSSLAFSNGFSQISFSIAGYTQTVKGMLTIDYAARTVGATDVVNGYFDMDNDSITFSQIRQRERETNYYLYYRQKAAIKDLNLKSRNIFESAYLEKGKIFYYVYLTTVQDDKVFTYFINDSKVIESKTESQLDIYCYTKALGGTIYDDIKLKQTSK